MFSKGFNRRVKKGLFNLSHEFKFTCEMGDVIPFLCQECVPGDKFKISNKSIMKFLPLVSPVMHNVDVYTRYFFVPNRLLWKNWESFITGGKDDSFDGALPVLSTDKAIKHSLFDYFGLPVTNGASGVLKNINALPFRAYNLIYNNYFIEQNIQFERGFSDDDEFDGENEPTSLFKVNWEKDYFTSATPTAQAGSGVSVPIGEISINETFPVSFVFHEDTGLSDVVSQDLLRFIKNHQHYFQENYQPTREQRDAANSRGATITNAIPVTFEGGAANNNEPIDGFIEVYWSGGGYDLTACDIYGEPIQTTGMITNPSCVRFRDGIRTSKPLCLGAGLTASSGGTDYSNCTLKGNVRVNSTSSISPVSIQTFRNAFKVQGFKEKLLRGGFHYVDWLLSFFGVRASDSRLQIPEYLGGSKNSVFFSEVLQTSESDTTPQGHMSGKGVGLSSSPLIKKFCEEHGWIIGLMYIKPVSNYMNGLDKKWTRYSKYDYMIPDFSNLGQQEIREQEIYYTHPLSVDGDIPVDNIKTFGYTNRYEEYRVENNKVAGEFRDSLKTWTLARDFDSGPELNGTFLTCNPSDRIYATSEDIAKGRILVDMANIISAVRPIPKYVEPASLN